ncbi:FAD-dependent oxidoreductase [Streptomyces monomycini]|uniref:FAD-dependent oxidoreductase n=1 Tax=Streptomyces monomycini TaxID=371720 RepID=UPI0023B03A8A|nr:FAD-dependent oxidoreductase [Streptomyces monomycini]
MSSGSRHPDVCVVGAGPVGLTTALGLAAAGVGVTVLESAPGIAASARALVHQSHTLEGFARLHVLDAVVRAGTPLRARDFVVRRTGERIRHSTPDLRTGPVPAYNLILRQDGLSRILLGQLLRFPTAEVRFGCTVDTVRQDGESVRVGYTHKQGRERIEARWAVGADGARSTVRKALGVEFGGFTWPDRFVATDIRYDFAAHGYADANFVIDPDDGAIIVRIDSGNLWRVAWTECASLPEESLPRRLAEFLARNLPGPRPRNYELVAHAPYRAHQRAAARFRVGRVLLAGDAAHVTNPTGGMGLTAGLHAAFPLGEALAAVLLGRCGEGVLDRYAEAGRAAFLHQFSPLATDLKRLVFDTRDPARLAEALVPLRRPAAGEELRRSRTAAFRSALPLSLLDDEGAVGRPRPDLDTAAAGPPSGPQGRAGHHSGPQERQTAP